MKICGALLVLFLAVAVCFAGCTGSQSPESQGSYTGGANETPLYVVGVDGAYPPYTYMQSNGTITGFDAESIEWIAAQKGFRVKIEPMDWDGLIPALNAHKIDMIYSGMTITPERQEEVNFSVPYLSINQTFAVLNTSSVTMDDIMAGKAVIGAQRGTTGAYWVEKNLIENGTMSKDNLKLYDNFPLAVTDLTNQRVDTTIYDRPSQLSAIEDKPAHIIGEINTGETYGVALRKDDTALLATLNDGLGELMASPKWQELLEKYGLN